MGADPDRAVVGVIRGAFAGDGHTARREERVELGLETLLGERETVPLPPGRSDPMRLAPGALRECDDVIFETEVSHIDTLRNRVPHEAFQRPTRLGNRGFEY